MRTESIGLRIWDTIEFYGRILNEEFDRASISALRNRCDFAFEKNNHIRAHRVLGREIDGTSDPARWFHRRILAQNLKYRRFPK